MTAATSPEQTQSTTLVQALKSIPDEYLDCRGIWHLWALIEDMHITESVENGQIVERHLQCQRCTSIRRDRFLLRVDRWQVSRLQVLHPLYEYAEDYLMSEMKDVDHPKELVRFEQLSRSMGGRAKVTRAVKKAAAAPAAKKAS